MTATRIRLTYVTALAMLSLLLGGATALEARSDPADEADAVLYETVETMFLLDADGNVLSLQDAAKAVFRKGISALGGTAKANTPFCPPEVVVHFGVNSCTVVAFGFTLINVNMADPSFGTGTVQADLSVNLNFDNAIDSAETAVLTGRIDGAVFLQPFGTGGLPPSLGKNKKALGPAVPLIRLVNGTFSIQVGVDDKGTPIYHKVADFEATFRLPFAVDRNGRPDQPTRAQTAFYLDDAGGLIRVQRDEFALDFPMVRAEVKFVRPTPTP